MKYTITQSFSTENDTREDEGLTKSFANKKEAKNYFEEIKNNVQQGGTIVTDFWLKDDIIDSYYSDFDYTPYFGKLVIAYQHEGKGMGYCHKFLNAFWLDKYNCNLSENPDNRFRTWETILDITKEDLDGLTYDEAVGMVEKEVRLRLNNSIDLSRLDIIFAGENEKAISLKEYADLVGFDKEVEPKTLQEIQDYVEEVHDVTLWDYPLEEENYCKEEDRNVVLVETDFGLRLCEI